MSETALSYERETTETTVRQIGRTALWGGLNFEPELGINDPLTHLEQFLAAGEAALKSIDEDLITDIAERKLKPTFINPIEFYKSGDDFISRQNQFSMRAMTAITKEKFARDNLADLEQYRRAKIESLEVQRLNAWFDSAQINDNFIVESLPLGRGERYAIVRIYQKTGPEQLVEQVITLHNADVENFNQLHQSLGAEVPAGKSALEVLDNMYAYRPAGPGFETVYIAAFDALKAVQNPGQEFNFGLPKQVDIEVGDDIANVRRQVSLRSVYLDMIRSLGATNGYASKDIIAKADSMGCGVSLTENEKISYQTARQLLDSSLQSVAATFNRASKQDLDALAASQDSSAAAAAAGHYGGQARAAGERYDGACPSSSPAAGEAAAAAKAYSHNQDPSQCGQCPKCKKEYFVPEKVYKDGVVKCNSCKEQIRFKKGSMSQQDIDTAYGQGTKTVSFFDLLALSFMEFNQRYQAERAEKLARQKARETQEQRAA